MKEIKLGSVLKLAPSICYDKNGALNRDSMLFGTVIYVHPKKRYFTAEFRSFNGGTFREAFHIQKEESESKPVYGRHKYRKKNGGAA